MKCCLPRDRLQARGFKGGWCSRVVRSTDLRAGLEQGAMMTPNTLERDAEVESGTIDYKLAESESELLGAFQLIYQEYLRAGLTRPSSRALRITPWHLLPTTEIFVAKVNTEVIATLTLVRDGELGMPLESIYMEEVAARRIMGLRMAEVSCLADRRDDPKRSMRVLTHLMGLMAQVAQCREVDELLIAVHPRHARFYARYIGFEMFGLQKSYSAVCDKPAIALELKLNELARNRPEVYQRYFVPPFPEASLKRRDVASKIHFLANCVSPIERSTLQPSAWDAREQWSVAGTP